MVNIFKIYTECITSLCVKASENYSCTAAENENKYFFCSRAVDCTGPNAGGIVGSVF